jgi:predicted NAD/FAD-dependent oxidoreductase
VPAPDDSSPEIAVVGAGLAGLACARRLRAAGRDVVLFDKGRAPGGRLATRRAEGFSFDHGAQYVTARGAGFAALLEALTGAGAVAPWPAGADGAQVGTPKMSALPRALAEGLPVTCGAAVTALARAGDGWRLRAGDTEVTARRVVLALPAPQARALLGDDPQLAPLAARLGAVRMAPCWTLMAAVAAEAPFVARRDDAADLAWIAQDSAKPGRHAPDGIVTWVAQASEGFSTTHLERAPEAVVPLLLPPLLAAIGATPSAVRFAAAHRWRYARVTAPLGEAFLRDDAGTLYCGGDWCHAARAEAAFDSGEAIARSLLEGA